MAKLKVFRVPIGFHDAYVAAPSQKAAIGAWGSDRDVFQRGEAELVDDASLTEEPLANPGKVIKRLRGTAAEQIAALGATPSVPPRRRGPSSRKESGPRPAAENKKVTPKKPSRAALDEAEAALAETEARHEEQLKALKEREAALARERNALEKKQAAERQRLETRREKVEAAYQEAMRRWRED